MVRTLEYRVEGITVDFIAAYLGYTEETEPPTVFHRWSAISAIATQLGRNAYIPFGHGIIIPNLYLMYLGEVGTRKSTAIKIMKGILKQTGFNSFAGNKISKEKFLMDMEGLDDEGNSGGSSYTKTEHELFGELIEHSVKECFIVADEFNEFATGDKLDFYSMLGDLWDWHDPDRPYTYRLKNSKSVSVYQPTINILGGNTQDNFARAFPPEVIGQGFMSRLLIIHGEPSGKKFTFPPIPNPIETQAIVEMFASIRNTLPQEYKMSDDAKFILDRIYKNWIEIDDFRFKNYSTRRFTQLLKLCIITAANWGTTLIDDTNVVYANTMLAAVEQNMPRALGEFGKSKFSEAANKIMGILEKAIKPVTSTEIWEEMSRDLDKPIQVNEILQGLIVARKAQQIIGQGFLARKVPVASREYVMFDLLTAQEQMMLDYKKGII